MAIRLRIAALCAIASVALEAGEIEIRRAIEPGSGYVELPAGVTVIRAPLEAPGARDLVIAGHADGSTLKAADDFAGRALIVARSARKLRLTGFVLDGNRGVLERPAGIAPHETAFADFYQNNGVLILDSEDVEISRVEFRGIAGFAVLANGSKEVHLKGIAVSGSGSRNDKGRNNTSGGVLFEEGVTGFSVAGSTFRGIRGNAVWTHSRRESPRNRDGRIEHNQFEEIGRDAVQIGHATRVRVENNRGLRIGYPVDVVDAEGGGTPVAIDTAGNVGSSLYANNRFEEINGKCIDLDGFHDGAVRGNTCVNRNPASDYVFAHFGIVMNNTNPDMQSERIVIEKNRVQGMKYGGIFLIGSGHRVEKNELLDLNTAGCPESHAKFGCVYFEGEPDLLSSGIYLGRRAERPAPSVDNVIRDNVITGRGMARRCIAAAPGVELEKNRIEGNDCRDSRLK